MVDRRTERTRQYLRKALMGILQEKPYEEVTVREVIERAQVSKNSFYNHYGNLDSLAQDCLMCTNVYFGHTHKRLVDYGSRREAALETLDEGARMLVFFRDNPNLARVILNNVCVSPYFSELRQAEEDLLMDHLVTEYGKPERPYLTNEDCARFITWGMFGHCRKWFMGGMRTPIEATVKEGVYLAFQCLAGVAGRPIEPEYLQAVEDWGFDDRGSSGSGESAAIDAPPPRHGEASDGVGRCLG